MWARVPTLSGPRVWQIRGPSDATEAARALSLYNEYQIATGLAPAWEHLDARYRREGPRPIEDWLSAAEVAEQSGGDCEDLAAYRAADLRLGGADAWPWAYRSAPGRMHVIVRTGDRVLDPARARGMEWKMRYRVGWGPDCYIGEVTLPGAEPIWYGYGIDPGDALATALVAADDDAPIVWPILREPPGAALADAIIGEEVGFISELLGAAPAAFRGIRGLFRRRRRRRPADERRPRPPLERELRPTVVPEPRPAPAPTPTPAALPTPATVKALALGRVAAAAREDEDAWRALATIARVLREEDPGGPYHRLVRALGRRR